jgi:adenylate cyclase class IV
MYEIEIKSLLGSLENAEQLKQTIIADGATLIDTNNQLNHYFILHDKNELSAGLAEIIPSEKKEVFDKIITEGNKLSVRTRGVDGKVILVIKASLGNDSSANGVSRIEFESEIPMTLDELDKKLIEAGLEYQAKWSRERQEYELNEMHVCIDKNAGYGYLAEFESVITDPTQVESKKQILEDYMQKCGVFELSQDRLERMFSFYNEHWKDYYGTDNVFTIE